MSASLSTIWSRAGEWVRTSAHELLAYLRRLPAAAWIEASLLSVIFTYGALLRFEAFQRAYGPLQGRPWWVWLQDAVADAVRMIRPESFAWTRADLPYRFDAKSYIDSARAMTHFYEARLREPLFVFATKVGQWLSGDQDIAVSMVSSCFSSLIILATYALGRAIGGAAVGLLGALFVAIERDLIWTGTAGYRDDLFALLTVLFAYSCIRLARSASLRAAVAVGIVAGLACLTRITALSFVVVGLAAVAAAGGRAKAREMVRPVVAAGLIALVLLAPFLIACWAEFGDPFYSISWHSRFYRTRAGFEADEYMGIGSYLAMRLREQPALTLHTGLRGLTVYPWANKWRGLAQPWGRPLAGALMWLSVAGILMWLWVPSGRIALVVFAASMLPYAFTWELRGGSQWRFTLHAYSFYLPAAAYAAVEPWRWIRRQRAAGRAMGTELRKVGHRAALALALVLSFLAILSVLSPLAVLHDLARGRAASVGGDTNDELLFGAGWDETRREGNVTFHYPRADRGTLWVPMSGDRAYDCLARLDALPESPGPPRIIQVVVNKRWVQRLTVRPDPTDVGRYRFRIPVGIVRNGLNRIDLVALDAPPGPPVEPTASPAPAEPLFRLWYLRFFPQQRQQR